MIKLYKLSSLIVLFAFLSFLNQVHAQFLFTLLGNGIFDSGNGIAVDKDENIYITGSFQESVDFDPSEREFLLEAIDDDQNYDIFIASYTKEGELRFAFNLGGKRSISYGKEIVLDSQGNIYITGIFRGIVDFDPSNREEELVSSAQGTNFFASYNNNGEFRFVMPLGDGISAPSEQAIAPQLEIDEQDNLYLYHFFFGTIDFDPSEEVFELSNQSSTYVASYSNNGNLRYAKDLNISINFNGNVLHGFSADHTGNSYIIGDFVGTVDFDPSDNVNELSAGFGERNIFVLSLDENGDFRYVFAIETIESASPFGILDLKIDQNGNLHIIGMMAGKMDFDPSLDVFELDVLTSFDMFYASYDREQSLRHAFLIGNEETIFDDFKVASPVNLDLDAAGNVYISGSFGGDGKVDFDPSSEVFELSETRDYFIVSYDNDGQFRFVNGFISALNENQDLVLHPRLKGITVSNNGNTTVVGNFLGSEIIYDNINNEYIITSSGTNHDIFIGSYNMKGQLVSTNSMIPYKRLTIFPNPTQDQINIDLSDLFSQGEIRLTLIDSKGSVLLEKVATSQTTAIDVSKYSSGIYYIQVRLGQELVSSLPIVIN